MEDSSEYYAIYKVGDDLQQDVLTLQMIRLMDRLWLHQGIDLKMVTFNCIPTSKRKGIYYFKIVFSSQYRFEHVLTGHPVF